MQGKTALWYDATSAAGSLESADSPNKGKFGYAAAPVNETASSGWLYTWAWAVQKASKNQDNAWKFIAWASSKEYEELVGKQLGWSRVPAGTRSSTYTNADYLKEAGAFAEATKAAIEGADPNNAGVQKRPAPMTLPHLRTYIELAGLLGSIYVVQNFDHVFTITGGGLGTANLPYYIYQTFYTAHDYGLASAAGVIVVILTNIVSTIALRTVFSIFREEKR